MVDFVNDPADIVAAFKPYFESAELSGVTDPYIVNELKAKLDGQALYDTFEVDRVVNVALKGKRAKPSELDAATTPVASRLLIPTPRRRRPSTRPAGMPRRKRPPRTRWTHSSCSRAT